MIDLPQASRQAAANAVVDLADDGAAAAYLELRTGSKPDSDSEATGTVLGTLPMSDPAFGAADATGRATANEITDDSAADATGVAGWFQVNDSDGNRVYQGTVTATGGGGDMELATTSIVAGQPIEITSLYFEVPENQS